MEDPDSWAGCTFTIPETIVISTSKSVCKRKPGVAGETGRRGDGDPSKSKRISVAGALSAVGKLGSKVVGGVGDLALAGKRKITRREARGTVFFCVQGKYIQGHCTNIVNREYRYSQLKVLHVNFRYQFPAKLEQLDFPARTCSVDQRKEKFEAYFKAVAADPELADSALFKAFMALSSHAKGHLRPSFGRGRVLWGRRNPLGPTFRAVVGQLQKNLKLLDLPENATVLDIGAGDGLASITLSRVHPDIGPITGIDTWTDAARSQLESNLLATFLHARVELIDRDICDTGLGDGQFDLVISCFKLHQLKTNIERENAIAEMVRKLKPGGQLFVLDGGYMKQYAASLGRLGLVGEISKLQYISPVPTRFLLALKPHVDPAAAKRKSRLMDAELTLEDILAAGGEGAGDGADVDFESMLMGSPDHVPERPTTGTQTTASEDGAHVGSVHDVWWNSDAGDWFTMVRPMRPSKRRWFKFQEGKGKIQYFNRAIDGKLMGTIKLEDIIGVPSAVEDKMTIVTQKRTYKLLAKDNVTASIWSEMVQSSQGQRASTLQLISDDSDASLDGDSLGSGAGASSDDEDSDGDDSGAEKSPNE